MTLNELMTRDVKEITFVVFLFYGSHQSFPNLCFPSGGHGSRRLLAPCGWREEVEHQNAAFGPIDQTWILLGVPGPGSVHGPFIRARLL